MSRSTLAVLGAIVVAGAVVFVVSGAFFLLLPKDEGDIGQWPLLLPAGLIVIAGIFLAARIWLLPNVAWTVLIAAIAALALSYLVTAAFCGAVACFQDDPRDYMGWYMMVGGIGAAVLGHLAYGASRPSSDG
ncbi:MAG: hypothetical protein AB7O56_12090 [Bauldia sp.]